jgi:alcohol dehydrogenase class IV
LAISPAWTLDDLRAARLGSTRLWVSPSIRERVGNQLPWLPISPDEPLPADLETLVVIGGGTLIDRAKLVAKTRSPALRLVAVPSLWGSGAEASPIAVTDAKGKKEIRMDPRFIPDHRVIWPELAASLSAAAARHGCGDCWAHALEGFLSPLATESLRGELAELMRHMLSLPLGNDPRWFEPSARACAGQAQSSVGLVHGIAHTLEAPLRVASPHDGWGHAKLCANFLYPVMEFNRRGSNHWGELTSQHGVDARRVLEVCRELFDRPAYRQAAALLREHWRAVLRDPCTRTNSVLVRPQHFDHFLAVEFA